jgi:hypothetical protein
MATWSFVLTIGGTPTDITSLVDIRSIKRERALFNELRPRTGKVEFRCSFSATVYAQLIAAETVDLAITKNSAAYFTGCLSPNYKGQIRNGQKYLSLIVEDWGLQRLGKTVASPLAYPGYAVCNGAAPGSSLVHVIAAAAGVTPASGLPTVSAVVPYVIALPEDKKTYAKLLEDILFDYGYVYYFLEDGTLSIKESVNAGTITTTGTLTTAAGSQNILGELAPEKSPEKYDDIRVKYNLVELKNGITVFQDTSGGDALHSCLIPLAAAGDADGKDYYPQTAKVGEVFSSWKSPDGYQIWVVASPTLVETHESGISISRALTNYYKKCSFAFRNTDSTIRNLTKLKITGNAYVVVSQNVARLSIVSGKNLLEHSASYLFSDTNAQNLARLLAQYYRHSDLKYSAKSKTAFSLGQYVLVSDLVYLGIAAKCRVVGIVDREAAPGVYEYELEVVADYTTTATTIEGESGPRDDQGNNDESSSAMRESWYNNTPPTNNVTGLAFTEEDNSDGSVNVNVAWEYTQGEIPASGFLVFYKSGTDAPDEIVLASDPAAFVAASETATAYSHTLAALSARFGGAGAVTRHYRFAVVAVSSCIGGMIPHNDGVVEDAAWIDKTFAPTIDSSEGGATLSIEGQSFVWRSSATGVELARIRNDVALSMLKASNLAALVRYRGSWVAGSWGSPVGPKVTYLCYYPMLQNLQDGRSRLVFIDQYLSVCECIISAAGVWGSVAAKLSGYTNNQGCLNALDDGSARLVLKRIVSASEQYVDEILIDSSGAWGSPVQRLSGNFTSYACARMADGRYRLILAQETEGKTYEVIITSAGVWGSPVVKISVAATNSSLEALADGRMRFIYSRGGATYELIIAEDGTWGSAVSKIASAIVSPKLTLLPDGTTRLIYALSSSIYEAIITSAGVWGSPVSKASFQSGGHYCESQLLPDGRSRILYHRSGYTYRLDEILTTDAFSEIPVKDDYAFVGAGIEEVGQNSNGIYIKFSDGTLEAWGSFTSSTATQAYTFPIEFSAPPTYVNFQSPFISTYIQSADLCASPAISATGMTVLTTKGGNGMAGLFFYWHARGRWK